jgi:hypothetical protein
MNICDRININRSLHSKCKRSKNVSDLSDVFYNNIHTSRALFSKCCNDTTGFEIDSEQFGGSKKHVSVSTSEVTSTDANNKLDNLNNLNKYDEKNQMTLTDSDEIELNGGANNIFKTSAIIFMLADATDRSVITNFYARIAKLKISQLLLKGVRPHISLMKVIINTENPDHRILISGKHLNPYLQLMMTRQYNAVSKMIYITSQRGEYEIMGDFFAKVYTASNTNYITQFRMAFYKYIEGYLGKGHRRVIIINNEKYYMYSYRGRDLLAIPDYYHGKGIWKPHMSIIKLDKIQKSNPRLYSQYLRYGKATLVNALAGVKGSLSSLNLRNHFNNLRISVI